MKISEHAKERYAERILGIPKNEARDYARTHNTEISYALYTMLDESYLLYERYAPSRGEVLDYWVSDEILLVVSHLSQELYTLFQITLRKNQDENSASIRMHVKNIKQNNHEITQINHRLKKQNAFSQNVQFFIQRTEGLLTQEGLKSFNQELEESIRLCKKLAAEQKNLRMNNRDLMDALFKKNALV